MSNPTYKDLTALIRKKTKELSKTRREDYPRCIFGLHEIEEVKNMAYWLSASLPTHKERVAAIEALNRFQHWIDHYERA